MKTYEVDIETDDYSALDEFALCEKTIHKKNVVIAFAKRNVHCTIYLDCKYYTDLKLF